MPGVDLYICVCVTGERGWVWGMSGGSVWFADWSFDSAEGQTPHQGHQGEREQAEGRSTHTCWVGFPRHNDFYCANCILHSLTLIL